MKTVAKRKQSKVHYQEINESLFPSFVENEFEKEEQKPGFVFEPAVAIDLSFRNHATQYLTHSFHSYPAKFIPQLPTWLMHEYSKEGDTILEPFAGSGTTLVEAILNNRNCYGTEINPIGRLTSAAKSTPIHSLALHKLKDELYRTINSLMNKHISNDGMFTRSKPTFDLWTPKLDHIEKWFLREVIIELAVLRKAILEIGDEKFKTLALVAFSSIVKLVSNARTDERNPKLRKELRDKPNTIKIFKTKLDKMSLDLSEYSERVKGKRVEAKIIGSDARNVPLKKNSVDLVITSPPYAYAMDYVRMHKLSLYWLGEEDLIELDKQFVGTERVYSNIYQEDFRYDIPFVDNIIQQMKKMNKKKAYIVYNYFEDMRKCFQEMYRVMKPKATAAIVIGNSTVQKVEIPTHICFNEIAAQIGFNVLPALERKVPLESKGLANVHVEYGGEMVQKEYINIFVK